MEIREFFSRNHERIVDSWFWSLYNDKSTRYPNEPPDDLRNSINTAGLGFLHVMVDDDWTDLRKFIAHIAQRRFGEGFKVSEVQKAFELYRKTLIPLLFAEMETSQVEAILIKLQDCMLSTITHFSEYFQGIHENFLRNHAEILEREINIRTHELAESRQKYKTLVEGINEGFFVLTKGRVVFANRAFAHMHGYNHGQVLQAGYLDFVAEEHRERLRSAYELSCKDGRAAPARVEYLRLCRDGSKLPTEIMAKRSMFGPHMANIGICRDISERVELEKRTRETEKLKALAQQAASVAHEVRNPLSTVKMNLQLFSRYETDPERLRLLQASLDEVDHIERSLQELMDISFPLRLSLKPVDLRRLLEHCVNSIRQRLITNNVIASLRLNRKLPKVNADPHRLEQAFINLLFNAVQAQPSGGRVAISGRLYKNDDDKTRVEIKVSDQGPGVPGEMLPYLFDPMFSQKATGNGLGLHNVKRIIEAHGGSMQVRLNRLKGISFYLSLPVECDNDR